MKKMALRDWLPLPPWEGLPVPRGFHKSRSLPELEIKSVTGKLFELSAGMRLGSLPLVDAIHVVYTEKHLLGPGTKFPEYSREMADRELIGDTRQFISLVQNRLKAKGISSVALMRGGELGTGITSFTTNLEVARFFARGRPIITETVLISRVIADEEVMIRVSREPGEREWIIWMD